MGALSNSMTGLFDALQELGRHSPKRMESLLRLRGSPARPVPLGSISGVQNLSLFAQKLRSIEKYRLLPHGRGHIFRALLRESYYATS
jgi:hypothetical protein